MKTYFKGIKTVAVIFLSLILFSCQDEIIVSEESSITESNQLMLKNARVNYKVSLGSGGGLSTTYSLVTNPDCLATCNSKQDLVWFDDTCQGYVTTSTRSAKLLASSLRLKGANNGYELIMHDGYGEKYFGNWEDEGGEIILPLENLTNPFIVDIQHEFEMYKVMGKGKNAPPPVFSGAIRIGQIVITTN